MDFFSIAGADFPDDAWIDFEQGGVSTSVMPDFIRPHLVVIKQLPETIALGNNSVRVVTSTHSSNSFPVDVKNGGFLTSRVLCPGSAKTDPYTLAFIGNAAIAESDGSYSADPILTNRNAYQDVVLHSLRNLFTVREDLLRAGGIDAQIRILLVYDETLPPTASNALANKVDPDMMETLRTNLSPFLAQYGLAADFVFVLYDSPTHDRATAWFTTDDPAGPSTGYTYDGVVRRHGHRATVPGSCAIPISVDTRGLTVLHEFGHGASDFNNGKVGDLYVEGAPRGFTVNKKWRASTSAPIPSTFANYNGHSFNSDPTRDGLGYPAGWKSYHPELSDSGIPNIMDNYWYAPTPQDCLFDQLTYRWFTDRLNAKLSR